MENGNDRFANVVENAERSVKQMAACGLSHSAKAIQELIRYTKALDKNQKGLIKTLLKLQRENKMMTDVARKMFVYLTPAQKKYIKEYAESLDKGSDSI